MRIGRSTGATTPRGRGGVIGTPRPAGGGELLDLDEDGPPDGEAARLCGLWLSMFMVILGDSIGRGLSYGGAGRAELRQARAWLSRGPAAWPEGLLLTLDSLGWSDPEHWHGTALPALRRCWHEADEAKAARAAHRQSPRP